MSVSDGSASSGQTLLNSWIEFGNRLLNFPLVAIAGLTFLAFFCWQRQQRARGIAQQHRRDVEQQLVGQARGEQRAAQRRAGLDVYFVAAALCQ